MHKFLNPCFAFAHRTPSRTFFPAVIVSLFSTLSEFGSMVDFFKRISHISSRNSMTSELKLFLQQSLRQPDSVVVFLAKSLTKNSLAKP